MLTRLDNAEIGPVALAEPFLIVQFKLNVMDRVGVQCIRIVHVVGVSADRVVIIQIRKEILVVERGIGRNILCGVIRPLAPPHDRFTGIGELEWDLNFVHPGAECVVVLNLLDEIFVSSLGE